MHVTESTLSVCNSVNYYLEQQLANYPYPAEKSVLEQHIPQTWMMLGHCRAASIDGVVKQLRMTSEFWFNMTV